MASAAAPALQETGAGTFQARAKERKFTPAEALRAFEAPREEAYRLDGGDEITVEIWGRPELSGRHVLGPDGRITLPVSGALPLAGLEREQAAAAIAQALGRYYTHLAVTVRVDRHAANRVYILGRVTNPGALIFDAPPTLLEAITRAGSLPVGGLGAEKAALTRCAVFRGRDRVAWIDLKALLTSADMSLNIRLQRNDIVYIPDADDQLVYVLGEVKNPGAFHLTPDMTFLDAISRAGGPTEDAAGGKIHLVRLSKGAGREIPLRGLLAADSGLNLALEEGDIVYVPRRAMAKFGYVMQRISPLSALMVIGGSFAK